MDLRTNIDYRSIVDHMTTAVLLLKSLSFTKTQFYKQKSLRQSGRMILDYGQSKPTKAMK